MLQRTMLALVFVLAPTLSRAFGLDQVPPLPDGIVMSLTIKSPADLTEKLDAYTVNATKATANALPPGLVMMLSQMYLPFPFALWQSDAPAHLVLVPDETGRNTAEVGIFQVDDYEKFTNELQENGWTMGEPNAEESAGGFQPMLAPGGQALVLFDAGDGSVAVAKTALAIRRAIVDTDWLPHFDFAANSDIAVIFPVVGNVSLLVNRFDRSFRESEDKLLATLKEFNISETFSQGLATLIRTYVPKAIALIGDWRGGVVELTVDARSLLIDATGDFADGSILRDMADQAGKNEDVDLGMASGFAADAVSVGFGAAMDSIIANGRERLTAINREAVTALFPDLVDEAATVNEAVWDAGIGRTTMAGFLRDGRQTNLTFYEAEKPADLAAAMNSAVGLFNAMADRMSDDPDLGVTVSGATTKAGGREFYEYAFDFANIEHFQEWLNRLMAVGNSQVTGMTLIKVNEDFRLFMATLDDGVLLAAGELTADEFATSVDEFVNGPDKAYLDQSPVAEVVESLGPRQISAALLDMGGLYQLMAMQNVTAYDAVLQPGQINPFRIALPRFSKEIVRNGSALGFAVGADNGLLAIRVILPSAATNSFIQNQELFTRIQQEEMQRIAGERQRQLNPDGPVDDNRPDGDNEEEEIELDEDPDAA
ncbi:MAG: hypothetical protein LIQ31_02870 [Planctomycetes bacterium]|nr:hypothetical protein [Planctomycetota bacterium]